MHGQVNGEALPLAGLVLQARPFSFHSTDCFQYWHGCTANAVLWFSFFSPPAILLSFQTVLSFYTNNYDLLSARPVPTD